MSVERKIQRERERRAMLAVPVPAMPPGSDAYEGYKTYRFLRVIHGMGHLQAYAVAVLASNRNETTWQTERNVAKFVDSCLRTVTYGVRKAKEIGLLDWQAVPRGKVPPRGVSPTTTGLSDRRFVTRGVRSIGKMLRNCAKWAVRNIIRLAREARNRAERREARAACAELRGPPE